MSKNVEDNANTSENISNKTTKIENSVSKEDLPEISIVQASNLPSTTNDLPENDDNLLSPRSRHCIRRFFSRSSAVTSTEDKEKLSRRRSAECSHPVVVDDEFFIALPKRSRSGNILQSDVYENCQHERFDSRGICENCGRRLSSPSRLEIQQQFNKAFGSLICPIPSTSKQSASECVKQINFEALVVVEKKEEEQSIIEQEKVQNVVKEKDLDDKKKVGKLEEN